LTECVRAAHLHHEEDLREQTVLSFYPR
jgi:hypothetical protein